MSRISPSPIVTRRETCASLTLRSRYCCSVSPERAAASSSLLRPLMVSVFCAAVSAAVAVSEASSSRRAGTTRSAGMPAPATLSSERRVHEQARATVGPAQAAIEVATVHVQLGHEAVPPGTKAEVLGRLPDECRVV